MSNRKSKKLSGANAAGEAIGGCIGLIFMGFVIFNLGKCMGPSAPPTEEEIKQIEANRLAAEAAGTHCLNAWDGSHSLLVDNFKSTLKDPSSFEHDKTIIAPIDDNGKHALMMRYRAKNGFGALTLGHVRAEIDNQTCSFKILETD